jgi:hypothetical protein
MYVKFREGEQAAFPVWENLYLVQAGSEDEAFAKAEKLGLAAEGDDDGSFRWGDRPARWVFGGVRKLTLCQDSHRRPGDGTELSYIQMSVRSERALHKLIDSDRVGVEYREEFPEQPASAAADGKRVGRGKGSGLESRSRPE